MSALAIFRKIGFATVMLAICFQANAEANIPYLEKQLGSIIVKFPKLNGFTPACEENAQFAQRAAGMTPKSSMFITCFVDAKKWGDLLKGKPTNIYPIIAVTVQLPQSAEDYTLEEFKRIRTAAHKQLGDMLSDFQGAQRRLQEQDRKLASSGVNIKRENYQQTLQGFFEPTGAPSTSFSFLVSRSTIVTGANAAQKLMELNAVSTIFYSGKLLGLNVVDQTLEDSYGLRVREITAEWLRAFRKLNEKETR